MSNGMNLEQAKEYAKTMTYGQAVSNCFHAKGIMYRKATLIKLHELAEIADRLDNADTLQTMYYPQVDGITPSVIVADTPQTDSGIGCSRCESRYDCYDRNLPHAVRCNNYGNITDEPQTDCSWKW